jgi:hypothetical protein
MRTLIAFFLAIRPWLWLSLGLIVRAGRILADFGSTLVLLAAKTFDLSARPLFF